MEKTLINQALKNAVGQEGRENTSVQAEKTDPAELSAREFEDFLASIVTGVIQNVVDGACRETQTQDEGIEP